MLGNKNDLEPNDIKAINSALEGGKALSSSKKKLDGSPIKKGMTLLKNKKYVLQSFQGKVLATDKSRFYKGKQEFIKKGTKWEDIPKDLKQKIHFSSKDFK